MWSDFSVSDLDAFNESIASKRPETGDRSLCFRDFGGISRLCAVLRTDSVDGLSAEEQSEVNEQTGVVAPFFSRKTRFGSNVMPVRKRKSLLAFVWERCKDSTIVVLIVCACISLALGLAFPEEFYDAECECIQSDTTGWVEGVAIVIAVVIVVLVGAIQDFDKERKFQALGKEDVRFIQVIRGGAEIELPTTDVLVGDVVVLECGKYVPADGYVVHSSELRVDESSMTGESEPVIKGSLDPWLIANTSVVGGSGRMLVGSVGERTEWGRTLLRMQEAGNEETPLQGQLNEMVLAIGKFGFFMGSVTFLILFAFWAVDTYFLVLKTAWSWSYLRGIVDALIIAVTLLVVGIPEGLPLAVIISLAYSMKAMTKDNILVRHIEACETMGGATNICSDKTGTLTQNKMTVMCGWIGGEWVETLSSFSFEPEFGEVFRGVIALNTTAFRHEEKVVGMPTEMALLDMVDRVDGSVAFYEGFRKKWSNNLLLRIPFSSETKRMISVFYVSDLDVIRFLVKGAPEVLLQECRKQLLLSGKVMDNVDTESMLGQVKKMADSGLRTLFLGYRDVPASLFLTNVEALVVQERFTVDMKSGLINEYPLVAIGVVGIEDPLRPEVPQAIRQCIAAGVTVRMITGDNLETAVKIAVECGIKTPSGIALSGQKFREMSDEELDEVIPQLQVLARSQPTDKLRLVQRLKAMQQIVAVTGDGTNDAPALREADVGFAMGIAGTDVAKEACDIIVMDDNFRSIVSAVKWGRNVYESIRKFLQFQLTVNLVALVLVFVGSVSKYGAPLRAVQLLWINLIMDTLAALALATEPPSDALLTQVPHGKTEGLINKKMWKHIIGQGIFQLTVLLVILYMCDLIPFSSGYVEAKSRLHYTLTFNVFVWMQLFNEVNARSIDDHQNVFENILKSKIFVVVLFLSAGVQVVIVEFGGLAFKVVPLAWDQWLFCVGVAAASLPVGFLLRAIPVPSLAFDVSRDFTNEPKKLSRVVEIENSETEVEPLLDAKDKQEM